MTGAFFSNQLLDYCRSSSTWSSGVRDSLDCPDDQRYWFGEFEDPYDCKYGSQLAKYVVMGGQLPDMPAPVLPGADGESDGDEYPEDESFAGMLMPGNFHLDV